MIVVVVNSGDFKEPSEWRSIYSHPRERPPFFLAYLFNRYVREVAAPATSPYPVRSIDSANAWTQFVAQTDAPIILVAYSHVSEMGKQCEWLPPAFRAATPTFCYDAGKLGGDALFRDAIHPSVAGNRVFARWIIQRLESSS